jgi:sugar/nucleoside kinase (ribokinase family)
VILVAGDLLLDIFLLPELRAEEQAAGLLVRCGGSAANTAAWMSRQGLEVCFVGCVGDDSVGEMLSAELLAHGVHTRIRVVDGAETGCVAVEVGKSGERAMRSSRGANMSLSPNDLLSSASGDTPLVHLTGYALLGPFGLQLLRSAGDIARSTGALLSFDPSSVGVINQVGTETLTGELERAHVGVLLPNREEALALVRGASIESAAQRLCSIVPTVVVKDGGDGAVVARDCSTTRVPTRTIEPLDTTGAGDAFNAGALSVLLQGGTLREACEVGHALAARAITQYGGRPGTRFPCPGV